jgi:hypothetical protein
MIATSHAMIFPIRLPIVLDTAIEKLRLCSSLRMGAARIVPGGVV